MLWSAPGRVQNFGMGRRNPKAVAMTAQPVVTAALLALAVPVLGGGHARADPGSICSLPEADCHPNVAGYLSELEGSGVRWDSDPAQIRVGREICADMTQHGTSSALEADRVRSDNRALSRSEANDVVDAALINLCPQLIHPDGEPLLPLD